MKKPQITDDNRKKWDNFWYYYKYHVLAGAFVLICIIIFVKDMLAKVDYDYCVSVIGNYAMPEEDTLALQTWFEEHAEDINGDGEIHVQVADYYLPPEGETGYDPQVYAASQTKLMVDLQEGTSMIYFLDKENYEKLQEMEAFPEQEETVEVKDCSGFQEIGSPAYLKDMIVTMRLMYDDSKLGKDEEIRDYYDSSESLMKQFVGN
nr:hypothetical protein [uncultured Blautia sp.]